MVDHVYILLRRAALVDRVESTNVELIGTVQLSWVESRCVGFTLYYVFNTTSKNKSHQWSIYIYCYIFLKDFCDKWIIKMLLTVITSNSFILLRHLLTRHWLPRDRMNTPQSSIQKISLSETIYMSLFMYIFIYWLAYHTQTRVVRHWLTVL